MHQRPLSLVLPLFQRHPTTHRRRARTAVTSPDSASARTACRRAPFSHGPCTGCPPPPLLSQIWMSNAHPLAPLRFSIEAAQAPPLPIPAPVLLLSFEVAPRVTSSLLTAGSPSPSAKGPLRARIMQRTRHRPSHGEHRRRPCHFCAFFKFFPP
jgi:hypothetical protein